MKLAALLLSIVVTTGVMQAQTTPAPKPPASKPNPAKPAPGKADPKSKEEEMGVIEGTTIARANGHFLGLKLESGKYKLTFYDKKKKPEKADVTRAIARWPNLQGPGDNRATLNVAGDGTYLTAPQFVRPPYVFKVFITLLSGEGDQAVAVENYTIDFRG